MFHFALGYLLFTVAIFLTLCLIGFYAGGWVLRRRAESTLDRLASGKLLLTYDDGPCIESLLPELMQLLSQYNAKATFFFVGFRVQENPTLCEGVQAEGHEIGSHTYWHTHGWRKPFKFVRDIDLGQQAVAPYAHPNVWFRPPFGKLTLLGWFALWKRSLRVIYWTVDSKDASAETRAISDVLEEVRRKKGGVVLLHDHYTAGKPEAARFTLELTKQLLEEARDQGWAVSSVSEIFPQYADVSVHPMVST